MNWKLIFLLSLSGLLIAMIGIFVGIGLSIEPYIMMALFVSFAIIFGKFAPSKYFLHGALTVLLTGLLMSIARLNLLNIYIQHNPEAVDEVETLLHKFSFIRSPLVILTLLIVIFGTATGLLTMVFGAIFKKMK